MALIDCPECAHKISDQGSACPKCGFPIKEKHKINRQQNSNDENQIIQPQSNPVSQVLKLIIVIIFIGLLYLLISSYFGYKEKTKRYGQKNFSEQVDSSYIQIPMLVTGAGEDGHYFLISHTRNNSIEEIKYMRKDNVFDSYGKMEIKCSNNEIRKYSATSLSSLQSGNLGGWYKISPEADWIEQDIVNFVCKRQSVPEQSQFNTERNTVEEPVSTPETLASIPMSDSFENGRYFLTSQATGNGIENIEYIREGNDNTSYAKMEIRCADNQIRKYSADNANALQSADMGDWITPTPDWTDQDIVNFICK